MPKTNVCVDWVRMICDLVCGVFYIRIKCASNLKMGIFFGSRIHFSIELCRCLRSSEIAGHCFNAKTMKNPIRRCRKPQPTFELVSQMIGCVCSHGVSVQEKTVGMLSLPIAKPVACCCVCVCIYRSFCFSFDDLLNNSVRNISFLFRLFILL